MNIKVLGGGLVATAIIFDLLKNDNLKITVYDINPERLSFLRKRFGVDCVETDLSEKRNVLKAVEGADIVVQAVPGFLGFEVLKTVIEAGRDVVDVSFSPEDPLILNDFAKEKGVCAVFDCGIAPGFSNIVAGFCETLFDFPESFVCYVGGLPKNPEPPFFYKAPFSPIDVIEEYTREVRIKVSGEIVTKPPLSDVEPVKIGEFGEFECFLTDGVRSLLKTSAFSNVIEKTVRYKGHVEKIKFLKESGFFDTSPVEVNGCSVKPIDATSRILINSWKFDFKKDKDITLMKVVAKGKKDGKDLTYELVLHDEMRENEDILSMSKTTGFTTALFVRLLISGEFRQNGVIPPEIVGKKFFNYFKEGLIKRGVKIFETFS